MYLTNYNSSKSPTNAGARPNIFKLQEEKERPETAYTSTEKKKTNIPVNSPDTNMISKKYIPTTQTPSTNKPLNMNYNQIGMSKSPLPETSSTPNLNKGGLSKYSFLNSGANSRPTGGFKVNKDLIG